MKNDKPYPPGYREFATKLKARIDSGSATWLCDICSKEILIAGPRDISLHIMVYPDQPYCTTKGLCFKCLTDEAAKQNVLIVPGPANEKLN